MHPHSFDFSTDHEWRGKIYSNIFSLVVETDFESFSSFAPIARSTIPRHQVR